MIVDTPYTEGRRDRFVSGDFSEFLTPELISGARNKGTFTSKAYDTVYHITGSRPLSQDAYAAARDAYDKATKA